MYDNETFQVHFFYSYKKIRKPQCSRLCVKQKVAKDARYNVPSITKQVTVDGFDLLIKDHCLGQGVSPAPGEYCEMTT